MGDWLDASAAGGNVDLSEVLGATALDAVVRVVATGALLSLGLSRDGGALAATVTFDGRWRREWFRECEGLTEWLTAGAEYLEGMSSPPAGQAPSNGSRAIRGSRKRL